MEHLFPIRHSYLIPLLPLAGALVAGFACTGARKRLAHWPIWMGVLGSAVLSVWLLVGMNQGQHNGAHSLSVIKNWYQWITVGNFNVNAGFFFDPLTAVMLCVVCGIGFLITVYAAGYMKGEDGYFRFFAYVGLFIFAMTCLVMGENLVMLYLGWEGVGLCSYLLIGYYYDKPSAREAAKKAFIVNRVGDCGFALGIMLCWFAFGTISYFGDGVGTGTGLLEKAAANPDHWAMQWIPFLLMIGAFGKSAQFPLHVWLPDAMEGPTPVSALIHAATMVTAGVYMIARCGALFVTNQPAMLTISIIGAFTALFAASIALRQFDLKKVFAYSTVSQLGYMFVGVGVLAPVAGMFHLVTHAFFKALLFLGCGIVMHAMAGELDMRRMSGLKGMLPKTRWLILMGCLALAAWPIPPFSGFLSKDEIVAAGWEHSLLLAAVLLVGAFLTSYYTFRLYYQVFEGPTILPMEAREPLPTPSATAAHVPDDQLRVEVIHQTPVPPDDHFDSDEHHPHHSHESAVMIWPLVILALGAMLAGYINWPGHALGHFLGQSPSLSVAYEMSQKRYPQPDAVNPVPFGQADHRPKDIIEREHATHWYLMFLSGTISLGGVWLARQLHLKDRPAAERIAARVPALTRLLEAKYWIDEIYQYGIVEPLRKLGRFCFAFDSLVIDGVIWLVGFIPQAMGFTLKLTVQRGYLQGYALAMLVGVVVILLVIFT